MFFWILLAITIIIAIVAGFYTYGDIDVIAAAFLIGFISAVIISIVTGLIVGDFADWEYQFSEERTLIEQSEGIYFETVLTDSGSLTCKYSYKTELGIIDSAINLYDTTNEEFYHNPVKDGEAPTIEIYTAEYTNQALKHWFWFCDSPIEPDRIVVNYNKDMVKEYKSCLN